MWQTETAASNSLDDQFDGFVVSVDKSILIARPWP